jgi:hypothetical protein
MIGQMSPNSPAGDGRGVGVASPERIAEHRRGNSTEKPSMERYAIVSDASAIGCVGTLTVATRREQGAGEELVSERAAELRQQELVAEVVKPAEADAERVRIMAVADAEKTKIQAEAAASHNRVALNKMLIDQLYEIVEKAALGLSGANLTVLNGAEGISEMATGLVARGKAIFDALRGDLMDYQDEESPDIHVPLVPNSQTNRGRQQTGINSPPSWVCV